MPSNKHEAAIKFAISKLSGTDWRFAGFRSLQRDLFNDSLCGWIPDAFRVDRQHDIIHVIEAGINSEEKWQSIIQHRWFIDNAEWFLYIHLVDYECLTINTLSHVDIARVIHSRLAKKTAGPGLPFEEWCELMGIGNPEPESMAA